MNENPQSNTFWEDMLTWFKSSSQYRALDTIVCEPMEFEWNIFPGFTTLELVREVQEFLSKMSKQPEEFTGRNQSSCRCSMTFFDGDLKAMNRNANLTPTSFLFVREDFHQVDGSVLGPGSEKKWYSTHESKPQGEWDRVAELMMIKFSESGHPVFRSTSPLS